MKILTVDLDTSPQDIFLYDSRLDIKNGFKLILPSPAMIIHRQIKEATKNQTPILLTGHQMGGGLRPESHKLTRTKLRDHTDLIPRRINTVL